MEELNLVTKDYLKDIFKKFINSSFLNFFNNVNDNGDVTLISDTWTSACEETATDN